VEVRTTSCACTGTSHKVKYMLAPFLKAQKFRSGILNH